MIRPERAMSRSAGNNNTASMMENAMLRKIGIVLAVIALGMTAIQTDAFARGGGGGGGGGGHGGGGGFGGGGHGGGFGGGGHFGGGGFGGGGHFGGGGFGGGRGFSGGHFAAPGQMGVGRGGFNSRPSGLRLHDGRRFRRGFGNDWGYDSCWPDYYGYNSCYYDYGY